MSKIYSHSKLWLFENCPEAYKIKYIDKTLPELPKTINMVLGSAVHDSLEWLYKKVQQEIKPELEDLIVSYVKSWKENFTVNTRLNNENSDDYFNKGVKFLADYYLKHKPFSDNTIHIEKKIIFPLGGEGHKIQGYIDRLVLSPNGEYEIHDYKTNAFLKKQEDVDTDRQLALYHLGLQELFGKNIKVKLVWHMLAHNKIIISTRTEEQLENLKEKTLELIRKIESNTEWPACGKSWCDWCSYKIEKGLG